MTKACKKCRRLFEEENCPICKESESSKTWKGLIIVFDPNSEIAKNIGANSPGSFAVKVK